MTELLLSKGSLYLTAAKINNSGDDPEIAMIISGEKVSNKIPPNIDPITPPQANTAQLNDCKRLDPDDSFLDCSTIIASAITSQKAWLNSFKVNARIDK